MERAASAMYIVRARSMHAIGSFQLRMRGFFFLFFFSGVELESSFDVCVLNGGGAAARKSRRTATECLLDPLQSSSYVRLEKQTQEKSQASFSAAQLRTAATGAESARAAKPSTS